MRPESPPDLPLRGLAGLLALALGAAALFGGLVVGLGLLLGGTAVPDAYESPSELWAAPATWGEFAVRGLRLVGFAWVAGLLALGATILGRYALSRPELRLRTRIAIPVGCAVLAAIPLAAAAWSGRDEARLRPDCDAFRFDAARWRSPDPEAWRPQALGLGECPGLEGSTDRAIVDRLGRPESVERRRDLWRYRGGALVVRFREGSPAGAPLRRVRSAEANLTRIFPR